MDRVDQLLLKAVAKAAAEGSVIHRRRLDGALANKAIALFGIID